MSGAAFAVSLCAFATRLILVCASLVFLCVPYRFSSLWTFVVNFVNVALLACFSFWVSGHCLQPHLNQFGLLDRRGAAPQWPSSPPEADAAAPDASLITALPSISNYSARVR